MPPSKDPDENAEITSEEGTLSAPVHRDSPADLNHNAAKPFFYGDLALLDLCNAFGSLPHAVMGGGCLIRYLFHWTSDAYCSTSIIITLWNSQATLWLLGEGYCLGRRSGSDLHLTSGAPGSLRAPLQYSHSPRFSVKPGEVRVFFYKSAKFFGGGRPHHQWGSDSVPQWERTGGIPGSPAGGKTSFSPSSSASRSNGKSGYFAAFPMSEAGGGQESSSPVTLSPPCDGKGVEGFPSASRH